MKQKKIKVLYSNKIIFNKKGQIATTKETFLKKTNKFYSQIFKKSL
jgi:hypothetical protein